MFILPSTIVYCLVLDGWLDFRPPHYWLRWSHSSDNITYSSWTDLFLSPISICLRLYLFVLRPFIPTIAPRNFALSLLEEKWDFDFRQLCLPHLCYFLTCKCIFTCKGAHSWRFNIWNTSAFTSCGALSPTFYGVMKIIRWGFSVGIRAGTLLLTFPSPIYIARRLWMFHFLNLQLSRINLKSPSIFS